MFASLVPLLEAMKRLEAMSTSLLHLKLVEAYSIM